MSRPIKTLSLSDFDVRPLESQFTAWGCKPRHARQVLRDYYRTGGQSDFAAVEMSRPLRSKINSEFRPHSTVVSRSISADGTVKFLLGMRQGGAVEAVLMNAATPGRAAGCV